MQFSFQSAGGNSTSTFVAIAAATVTAAGTIIAAAIGVIRLRRKAADTSSHTVINSGIMNVSNLSEGGHVNQTIQGPTHNYYSVLPPDGELVSRYVSSTPSPASIHETINKVKPFDRERISKNYQGLQVCWKVVLFSLHSDDDAGDWRAYFRQSERYGVDIVANIDIEQYPKLKVVDAGHGLWIRGKIKWVYGDIYLERNPEIILD